jgi:carboxypeptidase D
MYHTYQSSFWDLFGSTQGSMCLVSETLASYIFQKIPIPIDIANFIFENTHRLDLNLQGIWISDRMSYNYYRRVRTCLYRSVAVLSWDVVQKQIPAADFVHKYENVFALSCVSVAFFHTIIQLLSLFLFSTDTLADIDATAARCKYADYFEKFVTYPPKGLLPLPGKSTTADSGCDIWNKIFNAALAVNPAFNIYRIFDTFPILWDVLGFP